MILDKLLWVKGVYVGWESRYYCKNLFIYLYVYDNVILLIFILYEK